MKTRLFLMSLLVLLLLTACAADTRTGYFLEGESEGVAYLAEGSRLIELSFSGEDIERMKSESGLEGGEMYSLLFDTADYSYGRVSDEDFALRDAYYESLVESSGCESMVEAIRNNYRRLSSSAFFETVDVASGSFDEEAFAKRAGKSEEYYSYSFSSLLGGVGEGELDAFLSLWLNSAL